MEIRKPKIIEKLWGHEEIPTNCREYCGKKLHLNRSYRCSIHKHPKKETFFIESGEVYLELENDDEMECAVLIPGDVIDIPYNKWHRFSGLEDSVIIEFSTQDAESDRKTLSEEIPDFKNWKEKIKRLYSTLRKNG